MAARSATRSPAGLATRDKLRREFIRAAFVADPHLLTEVERIKRSPVTWGDGTVLGLAPRPHKAVMRIARRHNLGECAWAVDCLCKWPDEWQLEDGTTPQEAPEAPRFYYQCDGLRPTDDLQQWVKNVQSTFRRRLEVYLHGEPGVPGFDGVVGALEFLPLRLSRKQPSPQAFSDLARRVVLRLSWRDAFGLERRESTAIEEYRTRHAAAIRLAAAIGLPLRLRGSRG